MAVDSIDLKTRETSLTSAAVYYALNEADGSATAMTTPTVTAVDTTNMPGVFGLLIDESGMTTLTGAHDTEELVIRITADEMAPVTKVIEIYKPVSASFADANLDHLCLTATAAGQLLFGSFGVAQDRLSSGQIRSRQAVILRRRGK